MKLSMEAELLNYSPFVVRPQIRMFNNLVVIKFANGEAIDHTIAPRKIRCPMVGRVAILSWLYQLLLVVLLCCSTISGWDRYIVHNDNECKPFDRQGSRTRKKAS